MRPDRGKTRSLAGENIRMALVTVWSQKLRSGLTLLGIIIGVATVIAMVSMIQGLNNSISREISSLGTGVLFISKQEAGIHIGGMERRKPRKDITIDDAEAIGRTCAAVGWVSPEIQMMYKVAFGGQSTKSMAVVGGTEQYFAANNWSIIRGREISEADDRHAARVCVIGFGLAELLFPNGGELGRKIQAGDQEYVVIGVLSPKGKF